MLEKETSRKKPQITFVCAIESGVLEAQTMRMIESLRKWGGKFANYPVLAVTPRFGAPLAARTRRFFDEFSVTHINYRARNRYSWYNFMNKPRALVAAEEYAKTDFIGWLDSDLLFLGEPSEFDPKVGEGFLACTPDSSGGTTGAEDALEPYWDEVCKILGVSITDLPWVITECEKKRIRLYFNSGVFIYRRSTDFANLYLDATLRLLDAHISSKITSIFFIDQVVLGPLLVHSGITWCRLSHSHNYNMGSKIHEEWYDKGELKDAKILHYHDAMYPHFWSTFTSCIRETHPNVASWLLSLGSLSNEAPIHCRLTQRVLRSIRGRQEVKHICSCRVL